MMSSSMVSPPGSSVFKAFFFTPTFSPEDGASCVHTHVCLCTPESVTPHAPPLLYDLRGDPGEARPLTPRSQPDLHMDLYLDVYLDL
ncbi:unnamed protein product [Menidia menidia]|uniref:(Atlantic silverside) hypothetical protein n=1 Tax=Menidia menidia TaxID=238744 RepID=A0A8S4BI96_9TELE|nr:unnamed protein product [Menidia menidia]